MTRAHAYGAHLHSMLARVAHELRRRVEPHRLTVEQGARERCRLMTLEPRGVVYEQCKARRMRLGKTVFAEAEHLPVDALGEFPLVFALEHAVDELVPET